MLFGRLQHLLRLARVRRIILAVGTLAAVTTAIAVVQLRDGGSAARDELRTAERREWRAVDPPAADRRPARLERVCGKELISDWYYDGAVDTRYRRGCYAGALGLLPSSGPDYSSVRADLQRAYHRDVVSDLVDEQQATFRTLGLDSTSGEVREVLGVGTAVGGFAPAERLPAEVAVPLALPNPPGAERDRPLLRRYDDRAFLLARGRVYAMMIVTRGARTQRGIRIGDRMAKARRTYEQTDCYRAPAGERPGGGTITYPVCRVRITPKRYLSFGGDPIRSFTLFSRERRAP